MAASDLFKNIFTITGRTDLVAEIAYAIKTAVLKAHFADQWSRDLVEQTITPLTSVSTYDNRYVFDIKQAPFTRWRQLAYARETPNTNPSSYSWDNSSSAPFQVRQYQKIEPDSIFDSYDRMLSNTIYLAGNALHVRTSNPINSIDIGYYINPDADTSSATFSSWIADEYPYIIEMEAASMVFKMIGKDEEYQRFAAMWPESIATLRSNLLP